MTRSCYRTQYNLFLPDAIEALPVGSLLFAAAEWDAKDTQRQKEYCEEHKLNTEQVGLFSLKPDGSRPLYPRTKLDLMPLPHNTLRLDLAQFISVTKVETTDMIVEVAEDYLVVNDGATFVLGGVQPGRNYFASTRLTYDSARAFHGRHKSHLVLVDQAVVKTRPGQLLVYVDGSERDVAEFQALLNAKSSTIHLHLLNRLLH